MSDYTKSTNFATKDNLTSGNPAKIVKGTEIDTDNFPFLAWISIFWIDNCDPLISDS